MEWHDAPSEPLHDACFESDLERVKRCFKNGYADDVNKLSLHEHTPLYNACRKPNVEIVSFLLSHGASPSLPTGSGITPLEAACDKGDLAIATLLLRYGADPDAHSSDWTPSSSAAKTLSDAIQAASDQGPLS